MNDSVIGSSKKDNKIPLHDFQTHIEKLNSASAAGSFHVNSTNFWMFFHAPPRIVLKFGTVVEHGKKKPH